MASNPTPTWERDLDIPALDFVDDPEIEDAIEGAPPAGACHDVVIRGSISEQEGHPGERDDRALEPMVQSNLEEDEDVMIDLDHPVVQDILRVGEDQLEGPPEVGVLKSHSSRSSDLGQAKTSDGVVMVASRELKTKQASSPRLELEKPGHGATSSSLTGAKSPLKKRKKHISRKKVLSHASPDMVSTRYKRGKNGEGPSTANPACEIEIFPSTDGALVPYRSLKISKSLMDFSRKECLAFCESLCGPAETAYFEKYSTWGKVEAITASLVVNKTRLDSIVQDLKEKDAQAEHDAKRISDLEVTLKRAEQRVLAANSQVLDLESCVKSLEEEKLQAEKARAATEASLEARAGKLAIFEESLARERAELEYARRALLSRVQNRVLSFIIEREKEWKARGALEFRFGYLQTADGQEFLHILHRDILDSFTKSNEFMTASLKGLGFLIADVIRVTLLQVGASQEQNAKLDTHTFKSKMRLGKLGEVMGIVPNHADEWWIPIMDRAARHLLGADGETSDPSQVILYPLPCFADVSTSTDTRSDEAEIRAALACIFEEEPLNPDTRDASKDIHGGS